MKYGFDRLAEQVGEWVAGELSWRQHEYALFGDSPLERLFGEALQWYVKVEACEYSEIVVPGLDVPVHDKLREELGGRLPHTLILQPQLTLPFGRVDFVLEAYDWARDGGTPGWRRLIIECDGHSFHERTKEQAEKDRSRDRAAQLMGFEVFRFTGSELWRDPWRCASQVIEWAQKGLP